MKFAQIQDNKAHWIFEAESKPVFHHSIVLIDITGRDEIKEGWDYNSETGEFTEPIEKIEPEPIEPQPSVEQQILAELQYNTALTEMKTVGGR